MRSTRPTAFSAATACAVSLAFMHASTVLAADPPRAAPAAPAAAPTPPVSQPTPDQLQAARELFSAASKDEGASRWSDALEKLHRVADVKLTAGVRYHIAFCEEKLGQTATALAHFAEARDAAEREHNKEVLDLLKEPFLSDLHARVPTLSIDVPSDAKDAVVTIDDHPHPSGLWGVAVPVDPGTHRIDAHAAGRAPFSKELTLHEREVTVLDVVLPPSSPAPTPTPTSTSTPTPTSTSTSTSTSTDRDVRLPLLAAEIAACTRCRLSQTRTQTVFARGNPASAICFIGEAPGAEEDAQGVPFVGRAGQLLDRMIEAMGLAPERDVYIVNIIRCRPPDNRRPEPDEIAACLPYLHEQLDLVKPKVIVALG
ncbi:MAG: uracil-DNA glycosylase, partial [Polyangiaceae bacterium]